MRNLALQFRSFNKQTCLVMVERLFLTVPRGSLQFVIVVFSDHTHLLFLGFFYVFSSSDASGCHLT